MTEAELNLDYFDWMCQLVSDERYTGGLSYRKLFAHLHGIDFQYSMPMDGNRAGDGIDFRYRFGYENNIDDYVITEYLDNRPCSVFEMMVALAFRCEESIMADPDIGDRTGQWFMEMIDSLGLDDMNDAQFDAAYTDAVIFRFMNRNYQPNGKGGLFTIEDRTQDMRSAEIWKQMNWHLDSIT